MKKFLISSVILLLCLLGIFYAIYFKGFYIDFEQNAEITTTTKVEGKVIQIKNKEGQYEPFVIKGVDLPSSIAGYYSTDYAIDKKTYIKWFKQIQDMGANTIRSYTIYNDTFYNAFYEYNINNENPLYLIQGIQVSDYANNNSFDAYQKDYYYNLRSDAIDVVDVIHGKKIITTNKMKGSGFYKHDVSAWTLGYIIGNEWNAQTVKYTDKNKNDNQYNGEYFKTTQDATNFEVMLAKVMDSLVSYENDKYKKQSLITFASSPESDPFTFETVYAKQIGKFVNIDAEHIKATDELLSGYFASYKVYDYCPNFASYFSDEQKIELQNILPKIDTSLYYEGYTQLLQEYHTMPVVISGYGYSSSRGTDDINGPLNEVEQGQLLVSTYNDIIKSGCSGAFIDSWQDCWDRRGWNISYAVDLNEIYRWNDIQSESTGYGLISFESNDINIDGSIDDWDSVDIIKNDEGIKISTTSDEKGIYLFIEKQGLTKNDKLFIPIDVTSNSGSKIDSASNTTFNRAADFIIQLDGNNSKMVVQSRYESIRENYLSQIEGIDPFVEYPEIDDDVFLPIKMLCDNKNMIENDMSEEEIKKLSLFSTIETGKLIEGNSNPKSDDYNSLSDYYYGKNCVEIRIPWQMLNFYNPYDKQIHDDYYDENYGVVDMQISNIYIGAGEKGKDIKLYEMKLKDLSSLKYKQKLKESYKIVKKSWGE